MLNYRWKFRSKPDESTIYNLATSLKISRSLANILIARGVRNKEQADSFFEPSLEDLYDPFLMDGMDTATDRLLEAVQKGETIWIHGDYDVDGTSSASMLLLFLREIGARVYYFIPDRFIDGYGLSINSINEARKRNASILVTVDVGINSYEPIAYAKKIGMDMIICDHHEPGDIIPDVLAILDPMKPTCNYPFKHLSACGVVFKLIQGLCAKLHMPERAFDYLDFVVIASAADMVPLIGENRILSYYGLELLNSNPRPGIRGLIECTSLKPGSITASSIVYALAPLINAAGRLGDAQRAVEMMTQKDELASFRIAQELDQDNRRRRAFDEKTFEESRPIADKMLSGGHRKSLVILSPIEPHWHAGVIGIVASRLVDAYHLPVVLLTIIDNKAKGSARSIISFDIHQALKRCGHMLIEYGGHKHAAGLSLEQHKVEEFREAFDAVAQSQISDEMLVPEILIDSELELNELSPKFMKMLRKFAPFGFDNFKPVFLSRNVVSANGVKIIGKNHIKFRAFQSNFEIDAIGYNLINKISICTNRKPFSIVYNFEENNYNGIPTYQLRIKDISADNSIIDP
jgi:single-stranded-DNA-specific exonuclease